jgi:hypothetical protein
MDILKLSDMLQVLVHIRNSYEKLAKFIWMARYLKGDNIPLKLAICS